MSTCTYTLLGRATTTLRTGNTRGGDAVLPQYHRVVLRKLRLEVPTLVRRPENASAGYLNTATECFAVAEANSPSSSREARLAMRLKEHDSGCSGLGSWLSGCFPGAPAPKSPRTPRRMRPAKSQFLQLPGVLCAALCSQEEPKETTRAVKVTSVCCVSVVTSHFPPRETTSRRRPFCQKHATDEERRTFFFASASPCLSGCHFIASFLYAFFKSASDASRLTPKIL